jgi:class 3 adenylate cyclase/HAMP domain-containing protein
MTLRLFPKYALYIMALVGSLLLASGLLHLNQASRSQAEYLAALQQAKAAAGAIRIEDFVLGIERQLDWIDTAYTPADGALVAQRRLDGLRLMRQIPALAGIAWIDRDGRERLNLSRTVLDRIDSGADRSGEPAFQAAAAGKTLFGNPYFHAESEPRMIVARPLRDGGVLLADINLMAVWDVVSAISSAEELTAYVLDADGQLLAHPDIAQVLARADLRALPHVAALLAGSHSAIGSDRSGTAVFAAQAPVPSLGWRLVMETPWARSQALIDAAKLQIVALVLGGIAVAVIASFLLARALVRPLRTLETGAARIAQGDLGARIAIRSGDEIEGLAAQFNAMGENLAASYARLEEKVAERTAALEFEQARSRELLNNMLPAGIAQELARDGRVAPVRHESVSILFTDFSGFTQAAATMPADRMVAELNEIFAAFDAITERCGVEKIKTIGDAYMAAAGLPQPCTDHGERCVTAGLAMIDYLAERNTRAAFKWSLRVGVHSGPVVAGVVGDRKYAFDIWGDTVNIASRLESAGAVGRVNVSAYTFDLVRRHYAGEYRGKVEVKGKGGIDMYFITGLQTDA